MGLTGSPLPSVPKSYSFNHLKVLFGVYPKSCLLCVFFVAMENRGLTLSKVKCPEAHGRQTPIPFHPHPQVFSGLG